MEIYILVKVPRQQRGHNSKFDINPLNARGCVAARVRCIAVLKVSRCEVCLWKISEACVPYRNEFCIHRHIGVLCWSLGSAVGENRQKHPSISPALSELFAEHPAGELIAEIHWHCCRHQGYSGPALASVDPSLSLMVALHMVHSCKLSWPHRPEHHQLT